MPPKVDPFASLTPLFRDWFTATFGAATPPQAGAWPRIANGEHALVLAPTGSGKTLAAFYACLDDLYRRKTAATASATTDADAQPGAARASGPDRHVHTLYISPLKALNHDIHDNLQVPLAALQQAAAKRGEAFPDVDVAVRTGDTPQRERQRMVRKPPDVLITTPESLYLMLLAKGSRAFLTRVRYVIVDEIHAVAATKRGTHLALSLERLAALQDGPEPVRVGLSATVKPPDAVARFLGGRDRTVAVVDASAPKRLDVTVESPVPDFTDVDQGTVWASVYPRLFDILEAHRTTLVFANNRRLAERVAARMNALRVDPTGPVELSRDVPQADLVRDHAPHAGKKGQFLHEFVRAHHGSMSRDARLEMEALLKQGELRGLVATASLELGIDVGAIDCVALLGSPKSVARGLQRIGRSGHSVGATAVGRLFPLYREDLVECAVVARAMRDGDVEPTTPVTNALDVLAQQLVAHVAAAGDDGVAVDDAFALVTAAAPYEALPRAAFDNVLEMLAGKYPEREFRHLAPRLAWHRERGRLTALPATRLLATRNGGTIPDRGYFAVRLANHPETKLGELDEEFVYESRVGDVFLLGSQTWRIVSVDRDDVLVNAAPGEPPRMPFWRGEGQWRDAHLASRVARFHRDLAANLDAPGGPQAIAAAYALDVDAATNALALARDMRDAVGVVPDDRTVVVERFRDEIGDPRVVVHAGLGGRVTTAWALALGAALRKRLDADVQALATDDGVILRFPDAEAPPPEAIVAAVTAADVRDTVVAEVGNTALFAARFRENAERALLLPKPRPGRRTSLWLTRMRGQDLLDVARKFADFPMLTETYRDILAQDLDVDRLEAFLADVATGVVRVVARDVDVPSPFARSLLFQFQGEYFSGIDEARPVAASGALGLDRDALDGLVARTATRVLRDDAVAAVTAEVARSAPDRRARSADEFAHVLRAGGPLTEDEAAARVTDAAFVAGVVADGRAVTVRFPDGSERLAAVDDQAELTAAWRGDATAAEALVTRALTVSGLVTTADVARATGLDDGAAERALKALTVRGVAVRGAFMATRGEQWVDRENLTRMHRASLARLRAAVEAVPLEAYQRFLVRWHGLDDAPRPVNRGNLVSALTRLEGLALPGDVWERDVLTTRFHGFEPRRAAEALGDGAFTWVGAGERSRFMPVRRGRARFFVAGAEPDATNDAERAVLAALAEHGALHFGDVQAATNLAALAAARALHDLTVRGIVTNDDYRVMRHVMRKPRGAPKLPGVHARRRIAVRAPVTGPYALGRWGRVRAPLLMGPQSDPAAFLDTLADALLDRYGVVTREIAERETLAPWTAIARTLKLKEMRGDVRRGLFVQGLGGLQFAHVDAVPLLRAARSPRDGAEVVLLSTLDPAVVYGTGVDGGLKDVRGEPLRIARSATTHVALVDGRVVLVSEAFGDRVTRAAGAADDDVVAAFRALARLLELPAGVRPRRRLVVTAVDGAAPTDENVRPLLAAAGFEAEAGRMVAHRDV